MGNNEIERDRIRVEGENKFLENLVLGPTSVTRALIDLKSQRVINPSIAYKSVDKFVAAQLIEKVGEEIDPTHKDSSGNFVSIPVWRLTFKGLNEAYFRGLIDIDTLLTLVQARKSAEENSFNNNE